MGSSISSISDLLAEYDSYENYLEKTGSFDLQLKQLREKVTEIKKDFDSMTFKEFASKYEISFYNFDSDITAFVNGKVKDATYFKEKYRKAHQRR
jgi:hypothetical protein